MGAGCRTCAFAALGLAFRPATRSAPRINARVTAAPQPRLLCAAPPCRCALRPMSAALRVPPQWRAAPAAQRGGAALRAGRWPAYRVPGCVRSTRPAREPDTMPPARRGWSRSAPAPNPGGQVQPLCFGRHAGGPRSRATRPAPGLRRGPPARRPARGSQCATPLFAPLRRWGLRCGACAPHSPTARRSNGGAVALRAPAPPARRLGGGAGLRRSRACGRAPTPARTPAPCRGRGAGCTDPNHPARRGRRRSLWRLWMGLRARRLPHGGPGPPAGIFGNRKNRGQGWGRGCVQTRNSVAGGRSMFLRPRSLAVCDRAGGRYRPPVVVGKPHTVKAACATVRGRFAPSVSTIAHACRAFSRLSARSRRANSRSMASKRRSSSTVASSASNCRFLLAKRSIMLGNRGAICVKHGFAENASFTFCIFGAGFGGGKLPRHVLNLPA